jgi:hypothetical protein
MREDRNTPWMIIDSLQKRKGKQVSLSRLTKAGTAQLLPSLS